MTNMQKAITQHLEAAKDQRCTVAGISEMLGRDWRTVQDTLFTMTNVELHNGIWYLSSALTSSPIPTLDEMPTWLDKRHAKLNRAARECYRERNVATDRDAPDIAQVYLDMGDEHFLRSLAITAEWEAA